MKKASLHTFKRKEKSIINAWNKGSKTILIILILIPSIFVFYWMITSSLKVGVDIFAMPPKWFFKPTIDNYLRAFQLTPFLRYFTNSVVIAFGATALGLVIGLPAAYTIAKYRQQKLAIGILFSRIMPGVAYLVPLFLLFIRINMVGSYPAVILAHVVVTFPLTVWIMVGFFEGIPSELMDAAMIDGCSKWGTFVRIALPLAAPGISVSGILSFIFSWNDFKMALVLSNSLTRTLPVAVFNYMYEASADWGAMMAYATVITFPVLLMALFMQRYITTGLTMGAVKQ